MQGNGQGTESGQFQARYQQAALQVRQGHLTQARASYEALLASNPDVPEVHNDLGHVLRLLGQPGAAVSHLQRALELRPDDAAAAYNLAAAHSQLGQIEPAIASYRRALELRPDLAEAHNNLANLLRHQGDLEQAIDHYRKALALRPEFTDAGANLALTLENAHRLDEARTVAGQVLLSAPQHPVAGLVLAQIERREGELDAARRRLESLLETALPPVQLAATCAELGQVLDRLGDYNAAFDAATRGKRAWRELLGDARYNDDSYIQRIRQNRTDFSAQLLSGWDAQPPENSAPAPVFLVGFPRSGTTLTEQVLAAHPNFVTSHEKPLLNRLLSQAPAILGRALTSPEDLSTLAEDEIRRLREAYWGFAESGLGISRAGPRLIDKLPLNLVELGFIRRIFPESPLIMVLRDPRDACLSGYMQAFEPNRAMVAFLELHRTAELYAGVMDLWLHYREVLGMRWMELRYEDMVNDFETRARELLAHVGEEWDESVLRFHESAAERYANTPSYRDVTSPVYKRAVARWKNYEAQLAPVLDGLEKYVVEFGY